MWALRRAANPTRILSSRILVSRNSLNRSHPVGNILGRDNHNVPKTFYDVFPFSSLSRVFSSHTGAEDDLDEGFSDLDAAPPGIKDGELVSDLDALPELEVEGGTSADDLTDSSVEKAKGKISSASPLFQVMLDAPRDSMESVLDKWVEDGNPIGRVEFLVAMFKLRNLRLYGKALQFMEWLNAKKCFDYLERDYASHLDLVAKVHGLQMAEKYLQKIPKSFAGEVIYRTLLANCVIATNLKKAEEVFNKMRDLGFPVTAFACNQLLLLYKRVDRKKVGDVLILMEKENVKPSLFTYRLLIDIKGRANDLPGMEQVVETMKAEGVEPDLIIQAIIARHYIFGGLKAKAEAALKEMEGGDLKDNRNACELLLPLYADLGKADDVARVWKICESSPRLNECLAAIEAFGKLGHIEGAEEVFESMAKKWTKLSAKYYNALLKVYASHKLFTKGKDLVKRMSDSGCRFGPLTWDALVKLYVSAGEVEKADSILQKAIQQNHGKPFQKHGRPLYNTYITILDGYATRGDIHNAEKMFHRLKQNGYVGRMGQYHSLLQAYINAKAPAYGFFERMKADNTFPNKAIATQLATVDAFKKTQLSELLD